MSLLPKIQKNGYILEGFPQTYKEAKLFDNILTTITENDAQLFPNYTFINSLTPGWLYFIVCIKRN